MSEISRELREPQDKDIGAAFKKIFGDIPVINSKEVNANERDLADGIKKTLSARRQLRMLLQILDNLLDAACDDLMATSDEEILREAAEDGDSPEDIAARARERIAKAMEAAKNR